MLRLLYVFIVQAMPSTGPPLKQKLYVPGLCSSHCKQVQFTLHDVCSIQLNVQQAPQQVGSQPHSGDQGHVQPCMRSAKGQGFEATQLGCLNGLYAVGMMLYHEPSAHDNCFAHSLQHWSLVWLYLQCPVAQQPHRHLPPQPHDGHQTTPHALQLLQKFQPLGGHQATLESRHAPQMCLQCYVC